MTKGRIVVVAGATVFLLACLSLTTRGGQLGQQGQHHKKTTRLHCLCRGGSSSDAGPVFVVRLLGVKDKRGQQQGQHRGQQQGQLWSLLRTRLACASCTHSDPGKACDGAMDLATDAHGHLE